MKQWQIFLIAGLFLAVCNSLGDAEAYVSPVTLQSDTTTADIMTDDSSYNNYFVATLTLTNTNMHYRTMEVYLAVNQSSAAWNWPTEFTDSDYEELENNTIALDKGGSFTVKLIIFCDILCSAGDTYSVTVIGNSDPKWYDGGADSGTTGHPNYGGCQPNCTDHAVPSDLSLSWRNYTNEISIVLTARTAYDSVLGCDAVSSEGGELIWDGSHPWTIVTPGHTYLWGYSLENTGWMTDTYQFTSVVTSADGHNVDDWTTSPGMADGEGLTGQSDTSTTAVHDAAGSISITPATDAASGVYNIELVITSTGGASPVACDFDVVIPAEEAITVSVARVDTPPHPDGEWNYTWLAEVDNLEMDMNYTAVISIYRADDDWEGLDWWWDVDWEGGYNESNDGYHDQSENPFSLQRGCYHINADLYESGALHSDENSAAVLASADLDFAVGNGICRDGAYYHPEGGDSSGIAEKETEEEIEEAPREVPSMSLIPALLSIGIIALRRRR